MAKPLQVYIDNAELEQLEAWSRARGWSKSQAVRVAVRALIRPRDQDPLLQASGMIEGLPRDLSADFDRYLEETFLVPNAQTRKKARRRTRKRVRR